MCGDGIIDYRVAYGGSGILNPSGAPKYDIKYTFSSFKTLADGTRVVPNVGKLGDTKDAVIHSGTAVTLSGDGKIEVPINATLGARLRTAPIANIDGTNNTATYVNDKWAVHLESATGASYKPSFAYNIGYTQGVMYETIIKVNVTSGTTYIRQLDGTDKDGNVIAIAYNKSLAVGVYEFKGVASAVGNGLVRVLFNGTTEHTCDYTVEMEVRKITAVQGSVTVFDHATKTFEQPTLPLASTYTLKDGTYGTIIKLHTNKFSSADLDAFTARPELVLAWSAGTATIPSAIVKGAKDVVYNANGMALPVVLGAERIAPITATSFIGNGNTDVSKSGDIVTMTAKADGNCYMYLGFRTSAIGTIADGSNALCSFNYVSVSNDASFDIYTGYGQAHMKVNSGEFVFAYSDTATHYYRYNMNNAKLGDILKVDTSKISIKKVTSPIIPITGTHTTTNTSPYGIQQIKVGNAPMNGGNDGRYITLPLTQPKDYLVTECLSKIEGDVSQVIVTKCDGSTEVVT